MLLNCGVEKTLESPLDGKEIQPVYPKGAQSWVFIGRTDVEAETPILWPPDAKNWLFWKDPDVGKDWGQKEKEITKDEMVGWCHNSMGMSLGKLQELVMDREAWRSVIHGVAKSRTRLSNWTELNMLTNNLHNLYWGQPWSPLSSPQNSKYQVLLTKLVVSMVDSDVH